jgi:hypothetical protein
VSDTDHGRSRARVIFNLLRRLERDAVTGLVEVRDADGSLRGHMMVAAGRLCFAAPAAGQTPIGQLLVEEDPEFSAELLQAVADAKARNLRLCESLLSEGHMPLDRLRKALRRQIGCALLAMSRCAGEPALDVRPARDDYDRRLTFSGVDAFLAAAARLDDDPPDEAQRLFEEYVGYSDAALLLAGGESHALPLPVAACGLEEMSLGEVVHLARSAAETGQPQALARAGVSPYLLVFSGSGGVWVCGKGRARLVLMRTGPEFGAGQIVGFAARLWASFGP